MRCGVVVELGFDVREQLRLLLRGGLRGLGSATPLAEPWVLELCRLLAVAAVTGTIACTSTLVGAWLEFAVAPGWAIDLPPGRMLPENAAFSERCRVWYLEMFTEEIENSTMNSAISSVIMSA